MKRTLLKNACVVAVLLIIMGIVTPPGTKYVSANNEVQQNFSVLPKSSGPLGPTGQHLDNIDTIVMPLVDTEKLLLEDSLRQPGEPPRFAQSIETQINPETHGTWEILNDDVHLWRLRIGSTDAVSLNFGFTDYYMPEGGNLYVYTTDYSEVLGPYTSQDNTDYGQLWTPIINADEVVIEVSLPQAVADELRLELTSVNHGYQDFDQAEKSGACNVDTICSQADSWRNEIRSVGRYTISGMYLCTGALINNTAQDLKPYFLTANHCLDTSGEAASVVVYWNYQSPTCRAVNSTQNGVSISTAGFPTQSGSTLRATYAPSDMTLLELSSPVSGGVNAFWSGWDRNNANATSVVAIHHPQGHEKRISFSNQLTTITSYLGTAIPGEGTHLRVIDWDLGTTEGGSSGSPLYNQNHHIVGQLHGGYAACGNDDSDWYGRLYTSWTGGGTNSTRLSNWLDPTNSGVMVLNGIDASSTIAVDTVGVFRPTNGALYLKNSNTTGFADYVLTYGLPGDYPIVGDWNGDGVDTIGIYRNGTFYLRNSNTNGFADIVFSFGAPGDQPVAGDWNNDGVDTVGLYRSTIGTFFLRNTNSTGAPEVTFSLGISGDIGIAGDWNGDGTDTTGVFRPSNGALYLKNANTTGFADLVLTYGLPGDAPVTGDWNSDGVDTIGIYRNGTFYLRNSNTNGFADIILTLGVNGDMPIGGNWDGLP